MIDCEKILYDIHYISMILVLNDLNFLLISLKPASVQASFRLQKPVSEVVRHKGKIEHDILRSIGLSNNSKVYKYFSKNLCN